MARDKSPNYIVSPRTPDQLIADEQFLAKARGRSPKFPNTAEARERRQQAREKIAASIAMLGSVGGLAGALYVPALGLSTSALCLVSFAVICYVSFNRRTR